MENFKNHLRALIQLAMSDNTFDKEEKLMIYAIAKANKIPEEEVDALVKENIQKKGEVEISFSALSYEEKFEFLYNIIQMMKIDSEVYLSEIRYCQELAAKLGFDKKVVKKMAARVYSDPSISTNRQKLMDEMKRFEI